ncbi:MAG: ATP-binding cassette domain-containing protein [Cyclobacteriaceae bacterium]
MSESIINALVHLFAIFESVKEDYDEDTGELIVKAYLEKSLNTELTNEYFNLFHDYLRFYREANRNPSGDHELKIDSTSIIQIAKICNQINKELKLVERLTTFIDLLELIRADEKVSDKEREFASLVAMNFNLPNDEVEDIKHFIFEPDNDNISYANGLVVDNKMTEWPEEVAWMMRKRKVEVPGTTQYHHLYIENLFGRIFVLQLPSVGTYVFRYDGPLNLYLEGNKISNRKSYFLKPGSIIKGPNIRSIYETEITKQFLKEKSKVNIVLSGEDLEFKFKNSENGIQKFSFSQESGQLVGIMGGSGTGKSTLLNLLNGKLEPTKGRVHINGYNTQRAAREGVIGYVPQDDLLFEELTVFENLYYNAKICFSDFSEDRIRQTIEKVLSDLDLLETKDLKVGDPLNKTISGGQRKRLNIALELMREPLVLFVDEPTSGLSSMDSEKVMWLLKELARKGKLVIAIIHQPSSEIYKLLDKLWLLDRGGFPIYTGNPIDAVVYFKTMSTQVNAAESECQRCGNVIPDQILQIVEAQEIDDLGKETGKRRVAPRAWYMKYKDNVESQLKRIRYKEQLPPTNFLIPSMLGQFRIFGRRNLSTKITNHQYVAISLLQAPILAMILAYFSKYVGDGAYVFSENKNFPVFLFMSVVVSLFIGMSVSAEEIFKDRKILERESFLNLSRVSYINSKIFYLFTLSAIQTLSFIAITAWMLDIRGVAFEFWIILFSTSCFANLVGLNISAALNSIVTIYISIPFILVPQLLLGGAMIKFDDLHSTITNRINVPIVGNLMVSRWSYEALAVAQYKHNDFEKHFFVAEQEMSHRSFQTNYIIPRLQTITNGLKQSEDPAQFPSKIGLLRTELVKLSSDEALPSFPLIASVTPEVFNEATADRVKNYLTAVKQQVVANYNIASAKKDSIYYVLIEKIGKEGFQELRKHNFNESLSNIVTNRTELEKIFNTGSELIQKKDPIYTLPQSNTGNAHLYAPDKIVAGIKIDTVYFNIGVIWSFAILLYLLLLDDTFKKLLTFAERRKQKRKGLLRV